MTYTIFDPREEIIKTICDTDYDYDGKEYYYIPAGNDIGDIIKVRVYNSDEMILPPMPCVRVNIVSSTKTIHDIGGGRIYHKATIHFHIFVTTGENITPKRFINNICDELINRIMGNRNAISGIFVYPANMIDRPEESERNRIILHRIIQVEAEKFE